jgi:hypothetical protein
MRSYTSSLLLYGNDAFRMRFCMTPWHMYHLSVNVLFNNLSSITEVFDSAVGYSGPATLSWNFMSNS